MALRFFYRRQKLVFIIMAVLMVSFLIGYQGFQMIFDTSGGKQAIGSTSYGKVCDSDRWSAESDLRILGRLRIGAGEFLALQSLYAGGGDDVPLSYALLLAEAEQAGVRVSSADVENFLGADGGKKLVSDLKAFNRDITAKRLRKTLRRWLMIYKNYVAGNVNSAPSARELERVYCDLYEKVRLRVAKVRAEDFVFDIGDDEKKALTQPAAVQAQFEKYRATDPATFSDGAKVAEAFGFGYRHATARVRILYATVRRYVIEQAVGVYAAADADAREKLAKLARAKMDAAAAQAARLLDEYARTGSPKDLLKLYQAAGLIRSAADILKTRLKVVYIEDQALFRAVDALAEMAGAKVDRIFVPVGIASLKASEKVTLRATDITLGEALDRLVAEAAAKTADKNATTRPANQPKAAAPKKLQPPEWQWVTVSGLEGVLFPAGGDAGVGSLPFAGPVETQLVDRNRLYARYETLAYSTTAAGQYLADIAFAADKLVGKGYLIKVGQRGDDLISGRGVTVWRLVGAAPAGEPEELTAEIRKRVEADLEIKKAFALAWNYARELKKRAEKNNAGLLAAAGDDEKIAKVFTTEPLGRKSNVFHWNYIFDPDDVEPRPYELRLLAGRISDPKVLEGRLEQLRRDRRIRLLMRVPDDHRRQVMEAVFDIALAPENVAPPQADKPVAVGIIPIARTREVLVIQRIGYEPPAKDEYETKRAELAALLNEIRRFKVAESWFRFDNIRKRTGYTEKKR